MAVIFEDVKLLKERIDGRLPISNSLSSSQSSTSSNLSWKRASPGQVTKQAEPSDSLNISCEDHLQNGDQSRSMNGSQSPTSPDGEWVLFFKDAA